MNHQNIEAACKQLRLSGLALTLSLRLQEATANRLAHEEFLELLLQDELNVRKERLLARRTKNADFRHLKTLEEFDWRFNPAIPRKQIYDLATGQFIGKAIDILFLGPPGVGKTHLAQALGYEAIKMNFQFCIVPSLTWSATSSAMKPSTSRTECCANISSLTF
jgi:DNA replication protein DnaC